MTARPQSPLRRWVGKAFSTYATLIALLAICVAFSIMTLQEEPVEAKAAAIRMSREAKTLQQSNPESLIVIITSNQPQEVTLAKELAAQLQFTEEQTSQWLSTGTPASARGVFERAAAQNKKVAAICLSQEATSWELIAKRQERFAQLGDAALVTPPKVLWPRFLNAANLLNIASQISVIAIVAIGMTLVIITGGIDLSVGSLIALSSVVAARLMRDLGGAESASTISMIACSIAAIAVCAGCGLFTGGMITFGKIPPFIVTLSMMLVASGAAYMLSSGETINAIPVSYGRLGRKSDLLGIPNSVVLMLLLYAIASLVMSQTIFGRSVYAVGGNAEAARLSGLNVSSIIIVCYVISGALAGLGGIVTASLLQSGSPRFGEMDELVVIAAVVVGGTSLSGGQGNVFGTLVGALMIAVVKNGMNLTGVEPYTQKVVLGLVLLSAAVLDRWRAKG